MRKENEFGNVYHQMNFSADELAYMLDILRWDMEALDDTSDTEFIVMERNIIDRIEKELGIE
jgi:hypothetical protein